MDILSLLKMDTWDLKKILNKSCDKKNGSSWLFLPEDGVVAGKICIVAHIDTIHTEPITKEVYFDRKANVMWSPEGLGGDDRAGVYGALNLYNNAAAKNQPLVLLTDEEETGGKGAREAKYKELKQVSFFIELDRRGENDMVFYHEESDKFKDYIKNYGFIKARGSCSDIDKLCRHFKVEGVNLSIGFMKEHTKHEHLKLEWMHSTIKKVKKIIREHDVDTTWIMPDQWEDRDWGNGRRGHWDQKNNKWVEYTNYSHHNETAKKDKEKKAKDRKKGKTEGYVAPMFWSLNKIKMITCPHCDADFMRAYAKEDMCAFCYRNMTKPASDVKVTNDISQENNKLLETSPLKDLTEKDKNDLTTYDETTESERETTEKEKSDVTFRGADKDKYRRMVEEERMKFRKQLDPDNPSVTWSLNNDEETYFQQFYLGRYS